MLHEQQLKLVTSRLEEAEQTLKRERMLRQEVEDERLRLEREIGSLRVTRAGDTADISVLRDQIGKLEDSLSAEKLRNTYAGSAYSDSSNHNLPQPIWHSPLSNKRSFHFLPLYQTSNKSCNKKHCHCLEQNRNRSL